MHLGPGLNLKIAAATRPPGCTHPSQEVRTSSTARIWMQNKDASSRRQPSCSFRSQGTARDSHRPPYNGVKASRCSTPRRREGDAALGRSCIRHRASRENRNRATCASLRRPGPDSPARGPAHRLCTPTTRGQGNRAAMPAGTRSRGADATDAPRRASQRDGTAQGSCYGIHVVARQIVAAHRPRRSRIFASALPFASSSTTLSM